MSYGNTMRSAQVAPGRCPVGLPTFGGAMFGGYLLGTDYWADSSFDPEKDCAGKGRDVATLSGALGAKAMAGPTNYAQLPFTVDELCAANGECTLVAVAQVAPDQNCHLFSSFIGPGADYIALVAGATWAAQAVAQSGATAQVANGSDGDATRSGYEVFAASFSTSELRVWRSRTGLGMRPATVSDSILPAIGGAQTLWVGRSHAASPLGACSIASAWAFDRMLTDEEMIEFHAGLTVLHAGSELPVAG